MGGVTFHVHSASPTSTVFAAFAARLEVSVAQAREDLVHGVPGHADEAPAAHRVLQLQRAVRERAHQARTGRVLAGRELSHHVVDALPHRRSPVDAYSIEAALSQCPSVWPWQRISTHGSCDSHPPYTGALGSSPAFTRKLWSSRSGSSSSSM